MRLVDEYKNAFPGRSPPKISYHQADLSNTEETIKLAEQAKAQHYGKSVDILIANAGFGKRITDIEYVMVDSREKRQKASNPFVQVNADADEM